MKRFSADKINIFWALLLLGIGVAACFAPIVITGVWAGVFLTTLLAPIFNKEEWVWYGIAASPILEVWSRVVKDAVIVDEVGKYYLLLAIAMIMWQQIKVKSYKPLHKAGWIMIVLLLPSLLVNFSTFDREQWVFNILPTLELAILLVFVSRERWDVERFAKTLQYGLMPIVFVLIYIMYKTPSLSSVTFMLGANFKTAAGGTNQVATVLGMGILLTVLLLLLKRPITAKWICYLLLAFLFYRSFLTFSRGGVFSAMASIILAVGFAMVSSRKMFIRFSVATVVFVVLGAVVFNKVDELTGNMLSQRYRGETTATLSGEQEKTWNKVTSGRTTLIAADWYIFKRFPMFGVGPGGAKVYRTEYGAPPDSAAHTELTRLMSEHGIGGLLAGFLLFAFPIYWIKKQRYRLWKGVSAALFCMALLTCSHSAMRTNTTIVCYALAAVPVFVRTQIRAQ